MKNVILTTAFLSISALSFAQNNGKKEVLPKSNFDLADAKEKLGIGKSTITGIAVAREYSSANLGKNPLNSLLGSDVTGTKHIAPPGTIVMLFPVTEYFKEYYKLRERYKQSRKFVPVMSPEAFS